MDSASNGVRGSVRYSGWQEFQAAAGAASARARLLIGVRAFGYNIHIIHDKTRFGRDATMSVAVPELLPAGDAPARDYPPHAFESA